MDRQSVKCGHYPTHRGMVVALVVGPSKAALSVEEAEDVARKLAAEIKLARQEAADRFAVYGRVATNA